MAERREIKNLAQMKALAEEIAGSIGKRLLILLIGPMGSGKTQFTRFFMEALGSDEVSSPSFAIHNSYVSRTGPIEHMDLYRLESEDDLESSGFWDFFRAGSGVVIVEWADRLDELGLRENLPITWPTIEMRLTSPDSGASEKRDVELVRSGF